MIEKVQSLIIIVTKNEAVDYRKTKGAGQVGMSGAITKLIRSN